MHLQTLSQAEPSPSRVAREANYRAVQWEVVSGELSPARRGVYRQSQSQVRKALLSGDPMVRHWALRMGTLEGLSRTRSRVVEASHRRRAGWHVVVPTVAHTILLAGLAAFLCGL